LTPKPLGRTAAIMRGLLGRSTGYSPFRTYHHYRMCGKSVTIMRHGSRRVVLDVDQRAC
jgi:hypothetical protein